MEIEGVHRILVIDSESSCCILQPGVSSTPVESISIIPYGLTGDNLVVLGEQTVSFTMSGVHFEHRFLVSQLSTTAAVILGVDFFDTASR